MTAFSRKNVRVAVVGCGYWGKNLVRNFSEIGALACVNDHKPEIAQSLAEKHDSVARPFAEILNDPEIHGLVIAAPAEQHAALVEEGLLAGKDVYVEKPLALKVSDAERLCRLAADKGRILMVGHLLQYHPAFLKLKDLAASGELGRINYIYSNRLNLGKFRSEENALWSFAPHDISMILALIGQEPETVTALGHNYLHKAIADVTTTHMTFATGQAAHIHVSWLHPFKEQRLVVVGGKGMAVFDDRLDWAEKVQVYPHGITWRDGMPHPEKADSVPVPLDKAEPLRLECEHFLECIAAARTPRTDGEEGLRVLKVLDAAQRSMESGKAVTFRGGAAADKGVMIHESAEVDDPVEIGEGTKIWHFSHILGDTKIGENCNIGQNVVVGPRVTVGKGCKIQNNVSVYPGVTLEDYVFCGPSMVFTNVTNPRSEVNRKDAFKETLVRTGATIGANATVVCGTTIGRYAFIGAGAVVTKDVPDHALVVGNPARRVGSMCRCGERLPDGEWTEAVCKACGTQYENQDGTVRTVE